MLRCLGELLVVVALLVAVGLCVWFAMDAV